MRTTRSGAVTATGAVALPLPLRLAHHALLLLFALSATARKAVAAAALATAPKPTDKQRIEIRVQDFSFSDGPTEQQVIEIEAQDMRGSEIYDAILAIAFDDSRSDSEPSSEDEQLSHQDALLLAVLVLCSARLLLYGIASCWSLIRRVAVIDTSSAVSPSSTSPPAKVLDSDLWSQSLAPEAALETPADAEADAELLSRQSALLRLCYLQFVVVAEKLKHGLSDTVASDTVAALPLSLLDDPQDVTLADIVRVVEQIPLKMHGVSTERIERQMRQLQQDAAANTVDVAQSVPRLQDLYASLQTIHHTLETLKRTQRRRPGRANSLNSLSTATRAEARRASPRRRESSSSSSTSALTTAAAAPRELCLQGALALPQGFTADMFASLGQAIQLQTTPSSRIASDDECKRKQD